MDGKAPDNSGIEPYIYQPLRKAQIRLFHIFLDPGDDNGIAGELQTIDFYYMNKSSKYTALSYAWGPTYDDGSHLSESIICNGRKLDITPSLKQALIRIHHREVRLTRTGRAGFSPFWIDALCINQNDLAERSEQVSIMAAIFEYSDNVIIWLGEPDPGSQGQLQSQLLRDIHRNKLQPTGSEPRPDREAVLKSIVAKPWFHRRWVIQELDSEPGFESVMLLGGTACRVRPFAIALDREGLMYGSSPITRAYSPRYRDILRVETILQCLYRYDDKDCSDPRDRVFALRGLTKHSARLRLDYNQDFRQIYLGLIKSVCLGIEPDTDFFEEFVRLPSQPSSSLDSTELIRALAMASCKKAVDPDAAVMIESWIPNWMNTTRYESDEHKKAVQFYMEAYYTPKAYLSASILEAPNGYHYLALKGGLLIHPTTNKYSRVILKRCPAQLLYGRYKLEPRLMRLIPQNAQSSLIWLARRRPLLDIKSDPVRIDHTSIALVLVPSVKNEAFQLGPVYRIHACFHFHSSDGIKLHRLLHLKTLEELRKLGIELNDLLYLE